MTHKVADDWFNSVDFDSIISTVKGILTSDGAISILLDFERVLDECDIYAFKNWILGELVQGPVVGRYGVSCTFMWPYKLMPDPRAVKRLLVVDCKVEMMKTKIKVPVEVKNYDDLVPGTNYPKGVEKEVWLVKITIPNQLLDDIKEGSIDLAGSNIDLEDLDKAYDEDLDKQGIDQEDQVAPEAAGGAADAALAGGGAELAPPAPPA